MGITIHYKGKLDTADLIEPFCAEVEDIAKSMDWEITFINDHLKKEKQNLIGLIIKPHPDSELLTFVFDREGNLRNTFMVERSNDQADFSYFIHIKTQFAPIQVHVAVIKLLKYLKQKYSSNLEVWDEGMYWETNDIEILNKNLQFIKSKMDEIEDILKTVEFKEIDNIESIVEKIEKILKNKSDREKK